MKKIPRIEILCIGSELLKDRINTNSNLIARKLEILGLRVSRVTLVADIKLDICTAMQQSQKSADIVIVSGGLGPTFDDMTRESLAHVLNKKLILDLNIVEEIRKKFASIAREMPPSNKRQAYVIDGAKMLKNECGTAPGQQIISGRTTFFLLPGPPTELGTMMDKNVIPYLKKCGAGQKVESQTWQLFGLPESQINERLQKTIDSLSKQYGKAIEFTILAGHFVVNFHCFIYNHARGKQILKKLDAELSTLFGDFIFARGQDNLPVTLGKILIERNKTIACAESCTGGLIAKMLTDVPGSSRYFLESAITYSNASKVRNLNVPNQTIKKFGAVSQEVAQAMAEGILHKSGADYALATSGIAGPEGGSQDKPVGTVCFALASKNFCSTFTQHFSGNREQIREKAALSAIDFLRRKIIAKN